MSRVTAIVIHHSASPLATEVEHIRAWHRAKGWRDIGYHWLVRQEGGSATAYMGRRHNLDDRWEPWEYGAHSKGENATSIGICLIGNFDQEALPTPMWERLVDQCALLCIAMGLDEDAIQGHKEMPGAATACPGRYIPLDVLRDTVRRRLADSARVSQ